MYKNRPEKLKATLSIDLDNQWAYMKTNGDSNWAALPSYLDIFIPHFLDLLSQLHLKVTFFIVGQDAVLSRHRDLMARITAEGHEVGNHSFNHEPGFHDYSRSRIREEISQSEEAIVSATGVKPIGFRSPGFSWSERLFDVLSECGYEFDASTFPTYLGPLARAFFFATSKLSPEEKEKLGRLYGTFSDGLRPLRPYHWHLPAGKELLEVPVTTMPIFRLPVHMTYLSFLAGFSTPFMRFYLNAATRLCQATRTEPHFLLHPLDVLGSDQVPALSRFPTMKMPSKQKTELVKQVLKTLAARFDLSGMNEYVRYKRSRSMHEHLP